MSGPHLNDGGEIHPSGDGGVACSSRTMRLF